MNQKSPLSPTRAAIAISGNETVPMDEHTWRKFSRRQWLSLAPLAAVTGLAVPSVRDRWLLAGLSASDYLSQNWLNTGCLVPEYSKRNLTLPEEFPVNSYREAEPEIDLQNWDLFVEGEVARPGRYSLATIKQLPKVSQNVRHICIEGWSVVGSFGGARLGDFLNLVGAASMARFVEVTCLDDYYSSYDIASCRHPQSLLCYEMYGLPLMRSHGAPLRIHMPIKLGYKSAKSLFSLKVSRELGRNRGFWEDQGYSWYAGL